MSNKIVEKNNRWNWMTTTGVAIIFFGIVALISNYSNFNFSLELGGNWWAYTLLIPAIYVLAQAWKLNRTDGFSARVIGLVVGGVCILLLMPIFVFNLDWGTVWPLFFIAAGIGVLLTALTSNRS